MPFPRSATPTASPCAWATWVTHRSSATRGPGAWPAPSVSAWAVRRPGRPCVIGAARRRRRGAHQPESRRREPAASARTQRPDDPLRARRRLPAALAQRSRIEVDLAARGGDLPASPTGAPGPVVYTSGTTGRRARSAAPLRRLNLDAPPTLGWVAWSRTGCRSFHVHGLVVGARLDPPGRGDATPGASSQGVAAALQDGATMVFGVTMATGQPPTPRATTRSQALRRAALVSGSAALPAVEHEPHRALSGQRIVEATG